MIELPLQKHQHRFTHVPHSVLSSLATVPGGHSLHGAKPPLAGFIVFLLHLSEKLYLEKAVLDRCTVGGTVKPRYNAGRGRKNFEAKNRVIARSAL